MASSVGAKLASSMGAKMASSMGAKMASSMGAKMAQRVSQQALRQIPRHMPHRKFMNLTRTFWFGKEETGSDNNNNNTNNVDHGVLIRPDVLRKMQLWGVQEIHVRQWVSDFQGTIVLQNQTSKVTITKEFRGKSVSIVFMKMVEFVSTLP